MDKLTDKCQVSAEAMAMFLTVLADTLVLYPKETFSSASFLKKLDEVLEHSCSEDFEGLEAHEATVRKLCDALSKAVAELEKSRH